MKQGLLWGERCRLLLFAGVLFACFTLFFVPFVQAIALGQPGTNFWNHGINENCIDISFNRGGLYWSGAGNEGVYIPVPYIFEDKSYCDLFGGYLNEKSHCVINKSSISNITTKWLWRSSEGLATYEQSSDGFVFLEDDYPPWAYAGQKIQAIRVDSPNNWNQTGWCPPKDAPPNVAFACYDSGGISGTFKICKNIFSSGNETEPENLTEPPVEIPVEPPVEVPAPIEIPAEPEVQTPEPVTVSNSGGGGGGGGGSSRHTTTTVIIKTTPVVSPVTTNVVKEAPKNTTAAVQSPAVLPSATMILANALANSAVKLVTTVSCANKGQPGTCTSSSVIAPTKLVQGAMMNGYVYSPSSFGLTPAEKNYAACVAMASGGLASGGTSLQEAPNMPKGQVVAKPSGTVAMAVGIAFDYARLIAGMDYCKNTYRV